MPLITLFLVLIVIGVVVWAATTYIPMDGAIKTLIRIVGVIIAVVICLNAFGILSKFGGITVPSIK